MLKEIVDEIGRLWAFWSTLIFIVTFLKFWSGLEPPTPDTAIDYNIQVKDSKDYDRISIGQLGKDSQTHDKGSRLYIIH